MINQTNDLMMDWIREHFALLMLIGILGLMLIGVLAVHFPGASNDSPACPDSDPNCQIET